MAKVAKQQLSGAGCFDVKCMLDLQGFKFLHKCLIGRLMVSRLTLYYYDLSSGENKREIFYKAANFKLSPY